MSGARIQFMSFCVATAVSCFQLANLLTLQLHRWALAYVLLEFSMSTMVYYGFVLMTIVMVLCYAILFASLYQVI